MSYVKTNWKNGEPPAINADNLNKIEQGIRDAHVAIEEHQNDYIKQMAYAIANGTNTYSVNIPGITALIEGMSLKIKFQNANTGAATLNINGLGAKSISKGNGNALSSGNIKAGQICHLVYTGSVFQLLGEGGEYGTAQPEHVLEGYTIGTENGVVQGTMPNQGRKIITPSTTNIAIPQGYHDGTGYVVGDSNFVASNIRQGVALWGKVGTYRPAATGVQRIGDLGNGTYQHYLTVRGLNFIPKYVMAYSINDNGNRLLVVASKDNNIRWVHGAYVNYYDDSGGGKEEKVGTSTEGNAAIARELRDYPRVGETAVNTATWYSDGFLIPCNTPIFGWSGRYTDLFWVAVGDV